MASTYTTNLHVELQGTGDNSGTWGTVLNTTALTIIDQCLGDVQTVSLSSSNVTLTTAQSQHNYFRLTGSLSANVTITWPAIGRSNYVYNATTGSYSVTLANAGGGTTVVIPQGNGLFITQDPTNGVIADPIPFGTLQAIAGGTTIDLGTAPARNVSVTGSGWTCTSFGSSASTTSPVYLINFVAAGTLTYNATSMILPGSVSKTVAAGDSCFAVYLGSGNWRVMGYTNAATSTTGYTLLGVQTFTASGTYTPTSGCRYVKVTAIGAGGGGGGAYSSSSGASLNNGGGGGGEGATALYYGTAGASVQTVTVGTGGPGGSGSSTGTTGGSTSFGALAVAGGGLGGVGGNTTGIFNASRGGAGGTASAGTILFNGADGTNGVGAGSSGDDMASGGNGGGRGGRGGAVTDSGTQTGANGSGYGGGGGGAARADAGTSLAGGTGANGIVIIEEYA